MNTLYLIGSVDELMVKKTLVYMNRLENDEEIYVYLMTEGGEVDAAFAIYDILKFVKNQINIIVLGSCFSAGSIILMAGDKRTMLSNSYLMVHYGSEEASSKGEKKYNDEIFKLMKEVYSIGTKAGPRKISKWLNGETYMNAQLALKEGLIDEIKETAR